LGSETLVHARRVAKTGQSLGDAIVVKLPGHAAPGSSLSVRLDPAQLHVFDAETGRRLEPVMR
jgi:sn-glycerol 3-phosphate transport system ATP-binding protein